MSWAMGQSLTVEASWLKRVVEFAQPDLFDIQKKLSELNSSLNHLPMLEQNNRSAQLGYHSLLYFKPDHPHWIEIDLETMQPIDHIALVPIYADTPLYGKVSYGFPARFKIELQDQDKQTVYLIDQSQVDYPNPKGYPYLYKMDQPIRARYVKITSIKHWKTIEHWTVAFSEVMVLKGNQNIAVNKKVSTFKNDVWVLPGWNPNYLTDFQSPLGPPVSIQKSPSNGLLCIREKGEKSEERWMGVDLGEVVVIDEIRLLPSRPTDYADAPGSGFPTQFIVEGSLTESFEDSQILFQSMQNSVYPNPGDNPVSIVVNHQAYRYIRLKGLKLYERPNAKSMSLSEMMIYSNGQNIAINKKVFSSSSFNSTTYPRWYRQALVDGYNSQNKLLELPQWLEGLEKRKTIESTIVELSKKYALQFQKTQWWLILCMVLMVATIFIYLIVVIIKTKREKNRQVKVLRDQISRDLHDDIGSQLGGITLLSESNLDRKDLPLEVVQDFESIYKVANATNEAMRDIIWLTKHEDGELQELILHLQTIAYSSLKDYKVVIEIIPPQLSSININLNTSRHIMLAFKEVLHNIKKHAQANQVNIVFETIEFKRMFVFSVVDDGCGFVFKIDKTNGYGLKNLIERANLLKGECKIDSQSNQGTKVIFSVKV